MRATNARLRIALAVGLIVAACVGAYFFQRPNVEPSRSPEVAEIDAIPMQFTDDGWRLTHDCTLAIESPAYVQTSPTGKFITAPSVGLVPTNRAAPTHTVRPTNGTEVRIYFSPIPLKLSKVMPISEGKQLLTENDETDVTVTTMVIREGTRILPEQHVEIVDRAGKVVWKEKG